MGIRNPIFGSLKGHVAIKWNFNCIAACWKQNLVRKSGLSVRKQIIFVEKSLSLAAVCVCVLPGQLYKLSSKRQRFASSSSVKEDETVAIRFKVSGTAIPSYLPFFGWDDIVGYMLPNTPTAQQGIVGNRQLKKYSNRDLVFFPCRTAHYVTKLACLCCNVSTESPSDRLNSVVVTMVITSHPPTLVIVHISSFRTFCRFIWDASLQERELMRCA